MKKLILTSLILFAGATIYAQTADDYLEVLRTALKTEKKAAIAQVMALTEQEGQVFWPLYNEYDAEVYKIQTKRVEIIKDFAENFETMTDEKADELLTASIDYKQELITLTKKYYKKFKGILPAGKAAKFFQAENKIATLVDCELALEIPMVETP
jgi:glutamine amidotransferase-like uncharacterized protein